jgi:hypothetical protein
MSRIATFSVLTLMRAASVTRIPEGSRRHDREGRPQHRRD